MNEISPPSLRAREISNEMQLRKKEVIIGRERIARSIHSCSLPPHLSDPSHSLVSEVMEFKGGDTYDVCGFPGLLLVRASILAIEFLEFGGIKNIILHMPVAREAIHGCPPIYGSYKVSITCHFRTDSEHAGVGILIRDHDGLAAVALGTIIRRLTSRMEDLKEQKGKATGEHRWGAGQSSSDDFVSDLRRMINNESKAVDFGDLIPADCVLRRLLKELFAFASPALNTWRLIKDCMASEGSSWPQVRSEELSSGLSDREDGGHSADETPSVSGSSKDDGRFEDISLAAGMATAKLNKEKLKRMMEQKDVVPINLWKKRRGDTTSKPSSDEVTVRPPTKESAPIVQSMVTKEDVDEYAKLNTDVVKRALAHSLTKGLTEAMVVTNRCMHWEEGIVKLKSQLIDALDTNKTLSSTAAELTREKSLLTDELTKAGIEASMETAGAHMVEEYKSSDVCDDNNTKYFLAGFELFRKQAKEKYLDWDFDIFRPYEDDDSVAPADGGNDAAEPADPQLTDDATN
uniref:Uncharacterized protein n=1 Tax=Fagus sylvatica TaxID=28930 RepID=A0A2N9EJ31_FAGSY